MTYHLNWLLNTIDTGQPLEYLFFWGHQPAADGRITASCLSQWWEAPFVVEAEVFATAEHWMMAQKARLFGDEEIYPQILLAPDPAEAKALGRKVAAFDQAVWENHRFEIVVQGNHHKFSQHEALKTFLLDTAPAVLVEASPRDQIWGIGMGAQNPLATQPAYWKGQNLLGFALMEVRHQLATAR
ncbi:MAG: NADAR family protein [Microscillaceae bacterium]|nr:NADAR family protein [Microscillaceae bacterium]